MFAKDYRNQRSEITRDISDADEIYALRHYLLHPPGPGFTPTDNRIHYSREGQSELVDELLNGRRDGFYIECGAYDGVMNSNSLFFEQQRDWSGLLIEAHAENYQNMLTHRRKAYSLKACLSPNNHSGWHEWAHLRDDYSGLKDEHMLECVRTEHSPMTVHCFPFKNIMKALDITRIDYFSLDVEGAELAILKTIPWHDFYIEVLGVEYLRYGPTRSVNELTRDFKRSLRVLHDLDKFMLGTGLYERVAVLPGGRNMTQLVLERGLDVFYRRVS